MKDDIRQAIKEVSDVADARRAGKVLDVYLPDPLDEVERAAREANRAVGRVPELAAIASERPFERQIRAALREGDDAACLGYLDQLAALKGWTYAVPMIDLRYRQGVDLVGNMYTDGGFDTPEESYRRIVHHLKARAPATPPAVDDDEPTETTTGAWAQVADGTIQYVERPPMTLNEIVAAVRTNELVTGRDMRYAIVAFDVLMSQLHIDQHVAQLQEYFKAATAVPREYAGHMNDPENPEAVEWYKAMQGVGGS